MTNLLLIATIAGERVAIPGADVDSVVEIETISPVPRSAPHVAGLAAIRSRVLTVVDCRASLDLHGTASAAAIQDAVVVEGDGHPYALLVENVEDVLECPGTISAVRTSLAPGWARVAAGTVEVGEDLLLLIDTEKMISGPAAAAAA
jgi:purine-binding chemotaxis protein CheW